MDFEGRGTFMTNYPWLDHYLLSKPGAERDFKPEWQWERYLIRGKMFAAICTPGPQYTLHAGRTMAILKCSPLLAEGFRAQYADVVPGFYSDKRNWNSVYLDGSLPDEVLRDLCDLSYRLVVSKLPKQVQAELTAEAPEKTSRF